MTPTPVEQPNSGAGRALALPGSSGFVTGSGEGEYLGITVSEAAGSTATVLLYDNTSGSGMIVETVKLAANGWTSLNYPRPARQVTTGLYAVITGAVSGTVFQ